MKEDGPMKRSHPLALILAAVAVCLVLLLCLLFPAESLAAAAKGCAIWWDVLFPALFPFFLISELMLGFGLVHFCGMLLDPLMRPLFRIPGIGGFVVAMGFASGYPVGARLTSRLWEDGLVNREEGERLVAFTTSSDPIFLIGAVSVGFFGRMDVALLLAAAHYGSSILIGLLMRFHGGRRGSGNKPAKGQEGHERQDPQLDDRRHDASGARSKRRSGLFARAFAAMHEARLKDDRPFGTLLTQSAVSSIQLVIVVGGLVVLFSVFLEGLKQSGLLLLLTLPVKGVLQLAGIPSELSEALVGGLFEVTLGTQSAGQMNGIPLIYQLAAAAFILSWGGLSVHAQVVSLLHKTNLRYYPFLLARFLHGALAVVLVFVLWRPLAPLELQVQQTFWQPEMAGSPAAWLAPSYSVPFLFLAATAIIVFLLAITVLHWILKQLYNRLD